jgi:type IV secretion system protein VirB5
MKMIGLVLALAAAPAFAQVPVTVTSNIPGAAWHIEDIAKYSAQLEQMKLQVQQLEQTYASLNGSTGIGRLFQNPALQAVLPADWQGVYSAVSNGAYSGISGSVQSILALERTGISGSTLSAQASIVNREIQKAAADKAMGQAAYTAATQRLTNLQGLTQQIDMSSSPKQVMDLQARIASEQAAIQNEQTKLQLMGMLQRNETALIEQQKDQVSARVFNAGNRSVPTLGE